MKKRSFKDSDAILYSLSLLASISTMIFAQLFLLYIAYFEIIDKHNEILDAIPISGELFELALEKPDLRFD